jgi:uncharacterized membrane protein YbhN (UPF0104 family)
MKDSPRLPHVDRRSLLLGGAAFAALAVVVASPRLLRDDVGEALGTLADANAGLLWLAAACFAAVIACMAMAWRSGVRALGGESSHADAAARYAAGSFVAALVPAGAGGAARIALFSRQLPPGDRLWRAGGVSAAITVARSLALAVIVALAWTLGALPLWPIAVFLGAVLVGVAVALVVRRRGEARSHAAHVFDVFRVLARRPRCAGKLAGWTALAQAARVCAAASIAAAVGVVDPLTAGLVAVAALSIAGIVQLTPGNLGIGGGALALALHARGVSTADALSTAIAFQAVEVAISLVLGGAAVVALARPPVPDWALRVAGAGACVLAAGMFGLTVLV